MRVAILLLGVGAAAASVWWAWHEAGRTRADREVAVEQRPPSARFVADPVAEDRQKAGHLERAFVRRSQRDAGLPELAPVTANETTPAGDGEPTFPLLTREELEFRALKVEQEANHELQNLLGVLELTDEQQDRIFAALARHSDHYHPALQLQTAAGTAIETKPPPATDSKSTPAARSPLVAASQPASATKSVENDPVVAELPQELVPRYREYKSEREEFWAGVVEKIESQMQETGPGQ